MTCWHDVDPPQRPVLLINPRSGDGKAARTGLADRARERGIEVIVISPDASLAKLVDEAVARGVDALGVAGGDGSLAIVAAAAVEHGLPFVGVPAGTRNHFALDLGVDRNDPVGSLERLHRRRREANRRGDGERPALPQQRLTRLLRRRGSPADVPRREGTHATGDGCASARPQCGRPASSNCWTTAAASIATPP
jgi:Diacylglycerol kinase catalytic domain